MGPITAKKVNRLPTTTAACGNVEVFSGRSFVGIDNPAVSGYDLKTLPRNDNPTAGMAAT
jgi:hypothetical protein